MPPFPLRTTSEPRVRGLLADPDVLSAAITNNQPTKTVYDDGSRPSSSTSTWPDVPPTLQVKGHPTPSSLNATPEGDGEDVDKEKDEGRAPPGPGSADGPTPAPTAPTLHTELIDQILSHLPLSALFRISQVSRAFHLLSLAHLYGKVELDPSTAPPTHPLLSPSRPGEGCCSALRDDPGPGAALGSLPDPRGYVRRLRIMPHHDGDHGLSTEIGMAHCGRGRNQHDHKYDCDHDAHNASLSHELGHQRPVNPATTILPNLDVLELSIHPSSTVGWKFCAPSDTVRYPYYPPTRPCPLLEMEIENGLYLGLGLGQPRKLVLRTSRTWNSPSPFPLPAAGRATNVAASSEGSREQGGIWDRVQMVTLIIHRYRPGPKAVFTNGFLDSLPTSVRRLKVIFVPDVESDDDDDLEFEESGSESDGLEVDHHCTHTGEEVKSNSHAFAPAREYIDDIRQLLTSLHHAHAHAYVPCQIRLVGLEAEALLGPCNLAGVRASPECALMEGRVTFERFRRKRFGHR